MPVNCRRYDQEYKDMIVDLFKSGMSLAELSSEYGIAKSTINGHSFLNKILFYLARFNVSTILY